MAAIIKQTPPRVVTESWLAYYFIHDTALNNNATASNSLLIMGIGSVGFLYVSIGPELRGVESADGVHCVPRG